MPSMGYCKFENIVKDMDQCVEGLDDSTTDMEETELRARKRFIDMCVDVALSNGHEIDRECNEL